MHEREEFAQRNCTPSKARGTLVSLALAHRRLQLILC